MRRILSPGKPMKIGMRLSRFHVTCQARTAAKQPSRPMRDPHGLRLTEMDRKQQRTHALRRRTSSRRRRDTAGVARPLVRHVVQCGA